MIRRGYELDDTDLDVDSAISMPEARLLARPWPRYWARTFDIILIGFVVYFIMGLLGWGGSGSDNRSEDQALGLLVLPVVLLLDAVVLAAFGQTLGKALLGIRVESSDGERLSLATTLRRAARIWFFGMAAGIPIIAIGTMGRNYSKVRNAELTSWDEDEETRVLDFSSNLWRTLLAALICVSVTIGLVALPVMLEKRLAVELSPAQQLAASLPALNRGLPKQIDDATRFESISVEGNTVFYDYTLTDATGKAMTQTDAEAFADNSAYLGSGLKASTCERKATNLLSHGITMDYRYFAAGGLAKEVTIAPVDCD